MSRDTRTLKVIVVGNSRSAQGALRTLGVESNRQGRNVGMLGGRMDGLGRKFSTFGKVAAVALGAAALGAAKFTFDMGKTYEASLNTLGGLTGDFKAVGEAADLLESKAAIFAKLGYDTGDAAAGLVELNKSGRTLEEGLASIYDVMVLAKAGTIGVGEAAEFGSDMMNAFGLKATDMGRIANVLANGANLSSISIEDLRMSLSQVSAVAASANISLEDTTAAIALMGNMGIKGSDAGTSMKTFITRLTTDVAGSAKVLKGIGVQAFDSKKKMRPFVDIIGEVSEGLSKLSDKDRSQAVYEIFGSDAQRAANVMGKSGKAAFVALQEGVSKAGTATRQAEANTRGFYGYLKEKGALTRSAAKALSRDLSPALEAFARKTESRVGPALKALGAQMKTAFTGGAGKSKMGEEFAKLMPVLRSFGATVMPVIREFGSKMKEMLLPALKGVGEAITNDFLPGLRAILPVIAPVAAFIIRIIGGAVIGALKGALQVVKGVFKILGGLFKVIAGVLTGDWKKAWTGIKTILSGVLQVILGLFRVWWNLGILGIFKKGLSLVKAVFTKGWGAFKGIVSAAFNAIPKVVDKGFGLIAKGLTKLPGVLGKAMKGSAKWLYNAGADIVHGLTSGAGSILPKVGQFFLNKLPGWIQGPFKKALGIQSPSKVFAEFGKWTVLGYVQGITRNQGQLSIAVHRMHKAIVGTKIKGGGRAQKSAALRILEHDTKMLAALIKKRDSVAAKLRNTEKRLASLKGLRSDLASSISSQIKDFGGFANSFSTEDGANNSAAGLLDRFTKRLRTAQEFAGKLRQLAAKGLSADLVRQVAAEGVEQGGLLAQSLLGTTPGQIASLNKTNAALAATATKSGNQIAGSLYNAGIRAAEGLVKGLKSQQRAIEAQMLAIARGMTKAIKTALGIKSPSKVFKGIGGNVADGFALGIDGGGNGVQSALDDMASRRPGGSPGSAGTGFGGGLSVAVSVTVQGNVTAEKELAKSIAKEVRNEIERSSRNG